MPEPHPLDLYLDGCATVHQLAAGTPETSYYPALHRALNAIGATLRPKVVAVHHVSGRRDAGIPDFGLFVAPPRRSAPMPEWHTGATPERGVVEVKPARDDMDKLLRSQQVAHTYLPAYGLVLATNLWQFRLVAAGGQVLERLDLAATPDAFWALVRGTRPETLRRRFADFLQRCLLTGAPLTKPEDLAFFLASYARDALAALEAQASLPGLAAMRKNLETGLGLRFEGPKGERLFRSTLWCRRCSTASSPPGWRTSARTPASPSTGSWRPGPCMCR
jgi:hypothetical protein